MRRQALVTTGAIILTIGSLSAAQAWVTGSGTGGGKVHVVGKDSVKAINVVGGTGKIKLEPGTPVKLIGTFDNTDNPFKVKVHHIHVTVTEILGAPGACTTDDFAVTDPVEPAGKWLVPGGGTSPWTGAIGAGDITMKNDATHDPSGCLGATVMLGMQAD